MCTTTITLNKEQTEALLVILEYFEELISLEDDPCSDDVMNAEYSAEIRAEVWNARKRI